MKVAIIVKRLNVKGGTQRQALSLGRELSRLGHSIAYYTFAFDKDKCYPDLLRDSEVVVLPPTGSSFRKFPGYLGEFLRENRDAKALATLIAMDTVVLNPHDQVSYRVAAYFKRNNKEVPSVWMLNDMPTRTWSYWRESRVNPNVRANFVKRIAYWLFDWYDTKMFIKKQDEIVVLDKWNSAFVQRYFNREANIVRSGLDLETFAYSPHSVLPGAEFKILMHGIFLKHRRFEDGIEALALLLGSGRKAMLTIIGDYENDKEYYEMLKRLVVEKKVESEVVFRGRVSDAELVEAYKSHHAFVFANHYQTWGLAVFEAAASGIPVIVSRGAGAHEVLTDRTNALLVDACNPRHICKAVESLIDDASLYEALSKNGRQFVEENITWNAYALNMIRVFDKANSR